MNEKIDDIDILAFLTSIQQYIDNNCNKFGFEIDENESSISNGYNKSIDRYSIRIGLYLKKIELELIRE